jgi:hypothetical protein
MESIEQNDVDVSKLFNWGREAQLVDNNGKFLQSVYIRLVGDADLNRARVWALRDSSDLRSDLKKKGSDKRRAFIQESDTLEKDRLVELVVFLHGKELTKEIIQDIDVPIPTPPKGDATLEEQEEYQKLIDAYPEERQKLIREKLEKRTQRERERVEKLSKKEVYKEYQELMINTLCEDLMNRRFIEYCVFFGTYEDEDYQNRLFEDFEKFDNLPPEIKHQLKVHYKSLDISVENLKK